MLNVIEMDCLLTRQSTKLTNDMPLRRLGFLSYRDSHRLDTWVDGTRDYGFLRSKFVEQFKRLKRQYQENGTGVRGAALNRTKFYPVSVTLLPG